jgi:hypothetical protein
VQALLKEITLIKVENVSLERISIIDQNCNMINCKKMFVFTDSISGSKNLGLLL